MSDERLGELYDEALELDPEGRRRLLERLANADGLGLTAIAARARGLAAAVPPVPRSRE